jgi:hypothetical protein
VRGRERGNRREERDIEREKQRGREREKEDRERGEPPTSQHTLSSGDLRTSIGGPPMDILPSAATTLPEAHSERIQKTGERQMERKRTERKR